MELSKSHSRHLLSISLLLYAVFLPISRSMAYIPLSVMSISLSYFILKYGGFASYPYYLKRLVILLFSLMIWQAFTVVVNGAESKFAALPFLRGLNLLPIFLLPAVKMEDRWKLSMAKASAYLLLFTASLVIALGVFQKYSGMVFPFPRQPFHDGMLYGFFGHHIDAGGFFSTLSVFSMCLLIFPEKAGGAKKQIPVLILLNIILLSGALLSLSRTYYVSLIVIFPLIFLKKNRKSALRGLALMAVFILTVLALSPRIKERALSIADLKDNPSNTERIYLWRAASDIITENPVTGIGFKQWGNEVNGYTAKYSNKWNFSDASVHHAHNLYLTVAAETGLTGLIFFLFFWIYLTYILFKRSGIPSMDSFSRALNSGAAFGILNILIGGMFEDNMGKLSNILLLSYIAGISLFVGNTNEDKAR
jgi:O-antigen ligase